MDKTCSRCQHAVITDTHVECRAHPPVPYIVTMVNPLTNQQMQGVRSVWPVTKPMDFCGAWQMVESPLKLAS